MAQLPARWLRLPLIGGLLRYASRSRRTRPTGDELMRMTDAEFDEFIRSTGIKTVTTAGLSARDGAAD